mgnify:CR=1 FL=1
MGKNSKARATKAYEKKQSNKLFWLIAIPLSALVIKLIVMANTQGGGWLGADGENYLNALQGLLDDLGQIHLFGVFLELFVGQDRPHLWVVNESS